MYVTVDDMTSCDDGEAITVTVGMGDRTYELWVLDGMFGTYAELRDRDSGDRVKLNRP